MKTLFILLQYLVPQHLLSRLAGSVAECRINWVKNLLMGRFIKIFKVDMSEALDPTPWSYGNFNSFFTRALTAGARPICEGATIACPADGTVSQAGPIKGGSIFQAKGRTYSTVELLGGDLALAELFRDGDFATIYLSPRDYHRVHMPCQGVLQRSVYVPGDLFSVNQTTAERVPRLFARNERLVSIFDTPHGPMASVLVGAMIVAAIDTVWSGQEAPRKRAVHTTRFDRLPAPVTIGKGEEMGRFRLGSTVVLLFAKDRVQWRPDCQAGATVRMGQALGDVKTSA